MPTENRTAADTIKLILQTQAMRKQMQVMAHDLAIVEADLLLELTQLAAPRGHDSVPEQ